MKKLIDQITDLIDVKSFITFAIIFTLCLLAIKQNIEIPSELFAAVVSSIITYFFTKKSNGGTDSGTVN